MSLFYPPSSVTPCSVPPSLKDGRLAEDCRVGVRPGLAIAKKKGGTFYLLQFVQKRCANSAKCILQKRGIYVKLYVDYYLIPKI